MSGSDPYTFLSKLIAKDDALSQKSQKRPHQPLIVTVSRDYGAGGDTIASRLAEELGVPLYDRQILELAASKAGVDPIRFSEMDDLRSSGVSNFIFSVLTGSGGLETYRRALFESVMELSQKDCVLLGRGAHLILSGKRTFRVRVVGSRMICAKRIAQEFGLSLDHAERKVYEVNNKRHKSIENLFKDSYEHCSLNYAKNFDLTINTDRITADNAVPIVLLAIRQAGFDLSQEKTRV
ncbi:MAG: AAA family ATPase [Methylococcus sp.]